MAYKIPFNKPFIVGKELFYVAQSVLSGHSAGDGIYTKKCSELMQQAFSAKQVLLTTSCTSALETAAILCNFKPGDEIILPSYTFVSTANAFFMHGAKLRFVDIRPDTLNMDETQIQAAITDKTKAIVPVHYAGVGCEMDTILNIAAKNDLLVIEDAAQGVNAKYKNRYLGTLGDLAAYSFHETKNFICGEGGALLTNSEEFRLRAEIIREKGTNRSQFFRGEVDKYTWVDIGSSFLPSDILAAFLYAQLEQMDEITEKRNSIYESYRSALVPLENEGHVRLPIVPEECNSNCHMFYILLNDEKTRSALIQHLKERQIMAVFHYVPLHTSPVGVSMGYHGGMLPVTEEISGRVLRLPFFYEIQDNEIEQVVNAIYSFFK